MIYHYHAEYQHQLDPGSFTHIDGIITTKEPIDSMERYKEIKAAISAEHQDILIIKSLSLLQS